ncbi:MAG: hypothetical protein WC718_17815 [Phycisphaerales bacterium]|jgi:hypothetical protein
MWNFRIVSLVTQPSGDEDAIEINVEFFADDEPQKVLAERTYRYWTGGTDEDILRSLRVRGLQLESDRECVAKMQSLVGRRFACSFGSDHA